MTEQTSGKLLCLRCGAAMQRTLPVPEGVKHPLLREANRLMTQSLHIVMYQCPACGKLEFYRRSGK